MEWTHGLRDEYAALFRTCVIRPERTVLVDGAVGRILDARRRYGVVAGRTGVPWQVIAVIHMLEAGGRFIAQRSAVHKR